MGDETKAEENIDFMPTILSRFDTIFIIKDDHNPERDTILAKHVIGVHMNSGSSEKDKEGELSLKFIKNKYVMMRSSTLEQEEATGKRTAIPITVRQLEAIVRISESLAKMELQPFAVNRHVDEALRLFQVSTMDAALSGSLSGVEGFTNQDDQDMLNRIERQLKKRFAIGCQVSEHAIMQDFARQKYPNHAVTKVLQFMIRRGELQHRIQRKMLYRIK